MQENYDDISAAGGSLIAISSDGITGAKGMVDDQSLTFTVLSDTGKTAISAYNVLASGNDNIARPSVFIIKTDGTIGWKSLDSQTSRTTSSDIVTALEGLD